MGIKFPVIPSLGVMAQAQQIDISTLPYEQLVMLKNQFEQNSTKALEGLETFSSGIASLHGQSQLLIRVLGNGVLVPLTDSLYAPGVLCDNQKVLVDVGTGYLIEKTVPHASDYINRKLGLIGSKIFEADTELNRKREGLGTIQHLIQKRKAEADQKTSS